MTKLWNNRIATNPCTGEPDNEKHLSAELNSPLK